MYISANMQIIADKKTRLVSKRFQTPGIQNQVVRMTAGRKENLHLRP